MANPIDWSACINADAIDNLDAEQLAAVFAILDKIGN